MKFSKKGFTLVEVLAAAIILAIITIAIVFSLSFAQNMVQRNSNDDAYAAEVQAAADAIICYVNDGLTDPASITNESYDADKMDYMYLDASSGFDPDQNKIQFQIEQTAEDASLYKIKALLYYGPSNDRKSVGYTCYAHASW